MPARQIKKATNARSPRRAAVCLALLFATSLQARAQIDTALGVRSLSFAEAEGGPAVDLTGVVVFSDPPNTVFLQDNTAGTFFRLEGKAAPQAGDRVRVRGRAFPGLYLPGIEEARFEIIAHAGLPEVIPASYEDLASGRYHYQGVAVEGIVRRIVSESEAGSVVVVALAARTLEVRVDQPPQQQQQLVDAWVRITGLAAGEINNRRQLVEPYLRCRDWTEFEILEAAPSIEATPEVTPETLLTFRVEGRAKRRVRMRGVVLASFSNGRIYLRSGESAIEISLLESAPDLRVGDAVEVAGFPEIERFNASLIDALLVPSENPIDPGDPQAVRVSLGDLNNGEHDADLVSVTARLSDWYRVGKGAVLVLQGESGPAVQVSTPAVPKDLAAGAELQVTGICLVESTRHSQYRSMPDAVSLRARSADDIVILKAASWWTAGRLAGALLALLCTISLAALWIFLLRRQVLRQTSALRKGIEYEAALEERQRLAREFHDTLEQDLTGLSLRLDAASATVNATAMDGDSDSNMRGFLEGSRRLVSQIQSETRNLVADLREEPEKLADLGAALPDVIAQPPGDAGPKITFSISDELPALPSRTAHHLKMIAREAVTNALKHAQASRVEISIEFANDTLTLCIHDDGVGFEADAETRGKPGHFGCMGMRERARKFGADIHWKSSPGEGCVVVVRLPDPLGAHAQED